MPVVIHLETSVELSLVMHVHLFLEGVFCSLAKAVSSKKVYLQERPILFKHLRDAEKTNENLLQVSCLPHTKKKLDASVAPQEENVISFFFFDTVTQEGKHDLF